MKLLLLTAITSVIAFGQTTLTTTSKTCDSGQAFYRIDSSEKLYCRPVAGTPGPAGPQGAAGAQGPAGASGSAGATGAQGPAGVSLTTGTQPSPALQGTMFEDANGDIGVFDATGIWRTFLTVHGTATALAPEPAPGTGSQGPAGPQGPAGLPGATGPQGPQGFTGATGPAGAVGAAGAKGATGNIGATGLQGPQGVPGPQGPPGSGGTGGSGCTVGIPGSPGVGNCAINSSNHMGFFDGAIWHAVLDTPGTSTNFTAPALGLLVSVPGSSAAACTQWSWAMDTNFYYVCVSANTWRRVPLATF